ncbi:hypothetical protein GCM10018793_30840 [Streptomyces sulfonofaciens]|uniref:DUF11 domain-containing protein n=1 Tax=Streptomyces sulfonofaciens TaxID=68272 RepID=A0A919G7X0_9ACTN|nr:DUF11 domain-containing protein [Streptomyces sulfonofaciens]GHH79066.1 hypothetical protein GCM10018793_30840 [Streptomyces sulfonofaciens]
MIGTTGPGGRARPARLAAAVVLVLASLAAGSAQGAPGPGPGTGGTRADQQGRIAYAGTGHRSLGRVADPQHSDPLFGAGPAHFDRQASGRGDLLAFTSLRDEPHPQVYLRDAGGAVHRLTTGRDAAHPRLTPDGRAVVFDSAEPGGPGGGTQRDLWLVRTDGSGLTRLTDTPGAEISPTVSPDGSRLAFTGDAGVLGGWRIFVRELSGGAPRAVTDPLAGNATQPVWNPAGDPAHRDLVAYTLDPPQLTYGTGRADGSSGTDRDKVAGTDAGMGAGTGAPPRVATTPDAAANTPDAAGDGSVDDAPVPLNPRLRVTDGDGDDQPLLGGEQAGWRTRSADWLPGGDAVLFVSPDHTCTCDTTYDLVHRATAHAEETAETVLSENRAVDWPTWLGGARDGSVVVTRTTADGPHTATLQDMRADGTDPRDLGLPVLREDPAADTATDPAADPLFRPAPGYDPWTERQNYTPDGRRIVVTRFEDTEAGRIERIWLADADGADPHVLPLDGRGPLDRDTDPTFSPDGTRLAFTRVPPGDGVPGAGPSRVLIAQAATGRIIGTVEPPAGQYGNDAQPTWSPDGTRIAFTRDATVDGAGGNKHVWTAQVTALDRQQDLSATVCPGSCQVIDDSPAFSPDGTRVAFNRKDGAGRVNERNGVLIASPTGDGCRVVLPAGQDAADACTRELPDTTATGPFQPRDVAWSADGGHLVLSARRTVAANSPEGLLLLDLADGTLTPLDSGLPGRQKEPAFQQFVDLAVAAPAALPPVEVGKATAVTVTVTDRGPSPSPGTTLTVDPPSGVRVDGLTAPVGRCDTAALRCDLGVLAPGSSVRVTVRITGVVEGGQRIGWSAGGAVLDPEPGDNTARTLVPVGAAPPPPVDPPPADPPPPEPVAGPAVAVGAQPDPGYVGGRVVVTYTVRNGRDALATGLRLRLGLPAGIPRDRLPAGCADGQCALGDLAPGDSHVVRVVLRPDRAVGKAAVTARLTTTGTDADPGDNTARASLRVLAPRIVAVPPIGEPGFVTSVRGVDFPPGAPVRFTWKPGITAAAAPTTAARNGRFAGQLLILAKDQTGKRTITAKGPGFGPVTTPFLVVSGTIGPPDEVTRR